ncbi:TetR/AcrR family transcriptional regulator [Leptospira sp. 96542]|nr:TetR/AcrR family transcriptional regulator [Leptospira sp. 96542]
MRFTQKKIEMEYLKFKNPNSEKEKDILLAAERVFGEKGYEGATTKELAEKASVTERTLFKYFPTKGDLYIRILSGIVYDFAFNLQMNELKKMLEKTDSKFADWFLYIMRNRIKMAKENRHKIRILISAVLSDKDFVKFFGAVWKEKLYSPAILAMLHFQNKGEIRADLDLHNFVRTSFGINLSYLIFRFVLVPESQMDDESEYKKILEMISFGILNHQKT